MNPKQKRIQHVVKEKKKSKFKKYFIGLILLGGFIKLMSLGLEYLQ
jgi:hypothetical protein